MSQTFYLTLDDVVALHDEIVERMLVPHAPLLSPDRLESAIQRPRNIAYYENADLVHQAVVLAVGISQSQAFLDGNKRAAFSAANVFLWKNELVFIGNPLDMAHHLETVAGASKETREAMTMLFVKWMRGQVIPLSTYRRNLSSGQAVTGSE